jgi:hypothetical protein
MRLSLMKAIIQNMGGNNHRIKMKKEVLFIYTKNMMDLLNNSKYNKNQV